jgi:transposase
MAEVSTKAAGSVRRRWSEQERRRIVAESFEPGASVSVVARRHDINTNLLFTWRRRHLGQQCRAAATSGVVAAVISSASVERPPSDEARVGRFASPTAGRLEIELAGGCRVVACGEVDAAVLCRVIRELQR